MIHAGMAAVGFSKARNDTIAKSGQIRCRNSSAPPYKPFQSCEAGSRKQMTVSSVTVTATVATYFRISAQSGGVSPTVTITSAATAQNTLDSVVKNRNTTRCGSAFR